MDISGEISERARAGELLSAVELDALAAADLLSLGMLADEVRRLRVGDAVTYARVAEWSGDAGQIGEAGEVRITQLPDSLAAAVAVITGARAAAGSRLLTVGSLFDIIERSWKSLADVLAQLKGAGLDAIAEAPVDRITNLEDALQACFDADLPVRCLSLQSPMTGSRAPMLLAIRSAVTRFPGLLTVAPLSREQSVAVPTTGYDDVRAVALSRLALPSVPSIQVVILQHHLTTFPALNVVL